MTYNRPGADYTIKSRELFIGQILQKNRGRFTVAPSERSLYPRFDGDQPEYAESDSWLSGLRVHAE